MKKVVRKRRVGGILLTRRRRGWHIVEEKKG
jgi:hypothetical protein